jgi:cytochrome c oxidase accessory protein FixG
VTAPNDDFRNCAATASKDGTRLWVYARQSKGFYTSARRWLSFLQISFLILAPFVKINGEPVLMFNIFERRVSIFGFCFWPQDLYLFALAMITGLVAIALLTMVWGRVFCGWACPQTIFLEMMFRRIEWFIEGDGPEQRRQAKQPLRGLRLLRRVVKLLVFFSLSFLLSNVFLGYIVGGDKLLSLMAHSPSHNWPLFWSVLIFSIVFFWHFTIFREQLCAFLCPYARLQSVFIDKATLGVAYDEIRGEPRLRGAARKAAEANPKQARGDCVDCGLCVQVCPAGIDIRNGFPQLECVNCTACMDACDGVMKSLGKAPALIGFKSREMIEERRTFHFTPRVIFYSLAVALLGGATLLLAVTRSDTESTLLRMRGSTCIFRGDEALNVYEMRVLNKTARDLVLSPALEGIGRVESAPFPVKARQEARLTLLIALPKSACSHVRGERINLKVTLTDAEGRLVETVATRFLGPEK